MRGIVFTQTAADWLLAGRTMRMLAAAGVAESLLVGQPEVPTLLANANEPVWLVRAGSWKPGGGRLRAIPPSATGRALAGIGAGGLSAYLEPGAARALAELLGSETMEKALRKLARHRHVRAVPLHDVDVAFDVSPRVVQLVTSIQMGGAERVALDLAQEFNRLGWRTAIAAIGSPTRRAYKAPEHFVDLSSAGLAPENRADAVERMALGFGADVIHAHLIRVDEADAIRARGYPLAVTIHNALPIWPEGCAEAHAPFADMLIGCAQAVADEIKARQPSVPVHAVWNGVDGSRTAPTAERQRAGAALRESLGWDASDFVLLSVANPRPQKQLHRLPEIVARLEDLIAPRRVRLLLAGEPAATNEAARECMAKFHQEIERWHLKKAMHWAGAVDDVAPLLAASDALIAASTQEGLSLAQLEALAAGLPVVATNVGGTREIAAQSPRFSLLSPNAAPEAFAIVLAAIAAAPPPRTMAMPPDFAREAMARRTRLCLLSLLASRAAQGRDAATWVITNNFSTGGAQSSARRLLNGLHNAGQNVCAATLEEWPDQLSPGARALRDSGVRLMPVRPSRDAESMVSQLLEFMAECPPRAVLFWNVMPPVKLLLADLLRVPVFDVSPGEMLFQSLDRFFRARPAGWPIFNARDYGSRLAGAVVKYAGEADRAASVLGVPVRVIRNGIPLLEPAVRKPRSVLVIGTAARLSPDKRLEQLIDAFRLALPRMPRCCLHIAGGPDGDSKDYVRSLHERSRGLPVKWRGETRDVPHFLREIDLFAMISEPAGCPNASLEAMAAGLPVVASDHGGAREQVRDGVNGRLVPRGDVEAFAEALVELANDPGLRSRFGAAAREHVKAEFSLEQMIRSYRELVSL